MSSHTLDGDETAEASLPLDTVVEEQVKPKHAEEEDNDEFNGAEVDEFLQTSFSNMDIEATSSSIQQDGSVSVSRSSEKGSGEKEEEVTGMPDQSLLMELAEEDAREFDDTELDEVLPKSKFKDKSFAKLREFFDGIIGDLHNAQKSGIPLEDVQEEFFFIWDAIQRSHDNLETLLHRDLKLSVEVAEIMAKTRNMVQIAEDNPEKASELARRLETTWNLVEISNVEEERNAAKLEELETEIINLNRDITAAAAMEGRSELGDLMKLRKKLSDERDALKKELVRVRTSLTLIQERRMRQGDKKIEFQEQIKFAEEEALAQTDALRRETQRKERIEKGIQETIQSIEAKTEELATMEKQMSEANSKIDELERTLRDQKIVNDVAAREAESVMTKMEKLKNDVDGQVTLIERLAQEAHKRQTELRTREDEIATMKMEIARTERERILSVKKCEAMQETLNKLEEEKDILRLKIQELESDLERAQRRLELSRREVEDLDKQRTIVNKNIQRAAAVTGEHESQMKVNAIAINNLQIEIEGFDREISVQTDTIHSLERERDFYAHEATKLAEIVSVRVEHIKRLDLSILEHRRRVRELEDSAKEAQASYEATRIEKLSCERILRDLVGEYTECAKGIRNVRFEKYQQEYSEADVKSALIREDEKRDRLEKETEFLKKEAFRMKHMAVKMQREAEALEGERSILNAAVAMVETEISKQRHYVHEATSRKLNYQRKLANKEKDLGETSDKWKTLHAMVRIGAYHYRILLKEIRDIRHTIVGLRQEQLTYKGTNHVPQLRQEISSLENCIAQETCMVNALIEELKRPVNIHRWRVLEAIDPDAYNLVKKINIVTKRLVDHNEHIRQQNLRIADQEQVYVDIKAVMKHLPGLETPEERRYYQALYKAKKEQLEFLKNDMYTNEAQTAYFRSQVVQIAKRMEELKKEYFERKKKELKGKRSGKKIPYSKPTPSKEQGRLSNKSSLGRRDEDMEHHQVSEEDEDEHDNEARRTSSSKKPSHHQEPSFYRYDEEWGGEGGGEMEMDE